jgi:hypothetical protein
MKRFLKMASVMAFGLIVGWSVGTGASFAPVALAQVPVAQAPVAQVPVAQAPVDFGPPVPLAIETSDGRSLAFMVELADSPDERGRGLMFRESMAPDHGMLFDFGRTAMISMWMRNTVLPLDMIFANRKGRIVHIHEGAVPYSEAVISSRRRAYYVLELNAGAVEANRLTVGDRLVGAGIAAE